MSSISSWTISSSKSEGRTSAAAPASTRARAESSSPVSGEGEATMSFSRFGADYTIQFECKQIDGGDTCITEAEAKEFADSLFVAQTQ